VEPICKKIAEVSNQPKKERTEPNAKGASTSEFTADHLGDDLPTRVIIKLVRRPETLPKNQGPRSHQTRPKLPDHHVVSWVASCLYAATAKGLCLSRSGIAFSVVVISPGPSRRLSLDVSSSLSDHLFICDACDRAGVPDITCRSGPHTEEHHLIRCLAPEKMKEATSSTEQRLTSLEGRLDKMQTRFDDLSCRIGNIEQLLYKLAGVADALDSHDHRP
jgi:hypothetical protein